MRSFPRSPRPRTAQALAEFAIAVPFLLLLLAAVVEMGYYLYDFIGVQNGLRMASQAAMQARSDDTGTAVYSDDQIKQMVVRGHGPVNPILVTPGATTFSVSNEVTVYTLPADPAFGGDFASVTVMIEHRHPFILPILAWRESTIVIRARIRVARIPGLAP